MVNKFIKNHIKLVIGALLLIPILIFWKHQNNREIVEPIDPVQVELNHRKQLFSKVAQAMKISFEQEDSWPTEVVVEQEAYEINYTFDQKLENFIRKLLLRYRSDVTSVVVIDNNTGDVLSLIDHQRDGNQFGFKMSLANSHPAASIFKVITAAELLENTEVNPDTEFVYKGRGTTLYKYQLNPYKNNKWIRKTNFKRAFRYSNNVVFGKAAQYSNPDNLFQMAEKFKFNQTIVDHIPVAPSIFPIAADDYNLAELASGFNKKTFISPLHGALIAGVVANGGVYARPRFIKAISNKNSNQIFWNLDTDTEDIISETTAEDIGQMMVETVKKGTARGSFSRISRWMRENFEIGGKTGSITGGEPWGKRDWFISFAKPIHYPNDMGISVCVMVVNKKKWYVRSAYLAKTIIEYYYSQLKRDEYVSINR